MSVLGMDVGPTSAIARQDGETERLSIRDFFDQGKGVAHWLDWLGREIKREPLVFFVVERTIFSGRFARADSTLAMVGAAPAIAWSADVPRHEMAASQARSHLIDRPRRDKGESIRSFGAEIAAAVRARGFDHRAPHEAEAAALIIASTNMPAQVHG